MPRGVKSLVCEKGVCETRVRHKRRPLKSRPLGGKEHDPYAHHPQDLPSILLALRSA